MTFKSDTYSLSFVHVQHARINTVLQAIALHVKSIFCAPGEQIIHKGDAINHVYFVSSGSLEILDHHGTVVAILGA